jgi:hypothetical protein
VTAGRYVFQIGAPAGMRLTLAPPARQTDARPLAQALARSETMPASQATGSLLSEAVDDASQVTARAECTIGLFTALAEGRTDREALSLELDALVELLGRLDREKRFADALRLARSASALFALTLRWLAPLSPFKSRCVRRGRSASGPARRGRCTS